MTITVEMHQDSQAFDALADEWMALLARSPADVIFVTPAYQRVWWRHLGAGDLALLTARSDGALVGVAPLFAYEEADGARVLQTVGCVEVSDYLDWIVAPERETEALEALLDFLAGPDRPARERVDLCNIHQDSPTLHRLPKLARARGWEVQIEVQEVCPVVTLPDSWDEYLAMLDRKERHELRRKLRRAEAIDGLHWYMVGPEHDLAQATQDFLELMAKSAPEKARFLTSAMENFFRELIEVAFAAGWLELSFLELDGQRLASYLNFVYGNRVLSYNSGFDWEAVPRLGAGTILTAYLIRHAIEQGRAVYDFMRGDEEYKYRFGGQDVTVHRMVMCR